MARKTEQSTALVPLTPAQKKHNLDPILYPKLMIICQLCQKPFLKLATHLRLVHGTTLAAYCQQFPDSDTEISANTFTEEAAQKVIDYVKKGLTVIQAAQMARLNPEAVSYWLEHGAGLETPILRKFYYDIQQAHAEFVARHVDNVNMASEIDPRISMWMLERRGGFIQKTKTEISEAPTEITVLWGTETQKQIEN